MVFIQARWFRKGRQGKKIRLIVIHCTVSKEMGTGAENVARYFARSERKGSTHAVADNNSVVFCVRDEDTAYGAGGANNDGLHLELVGMPEQSFVEWLDEYGLDMFDQAAPVVRRWSDTYDVPLRWLTVDEIRAGLPGLCTHADVEKAYPSTGHWDPGPHFPKGEFLEAVTPQRKAFPMAGLNELDDRKGQARVLIRTYLGRNFDSTKEQDEHIMRLAQVGFDARARELADHPLGKAWEAHQRGSYVHPR